jgi:hypothetical protein
VGVNWGVGFYFEVQPPHISKVHHWNSFSQDPWESMCDALSLPTLCLSRHSCRRAHFEAAKYFGLDPAQVHTSRHHMTNSSDPS